MTAGNDISNVKVIKRNRSEIAKIENDVSSTIGNQNVMFKPAKKPIKKRFSQVVGNNFTRRLKLNKHR